MSSEKLFGASQRTVQGESATTSAAKAAAIRIKPPADSAMRNERKKLDWKVTHNGRGLYPDVKNPGL